jgi:hypothetical protein
MGAALVGFVGVVVGVVLSGTMTMLIARRAEQRQACAAARLLETELRSIASSLTLLVAALKVSDNYSDIRGQLHLPPLQGWETHKALLAAVLPPQEWYAVAAACEAVDSLRAAASRNEFFVNSGRQVTHAAIGDLLVDLANDVMSGAAAVSKRAGNSSPHPPPLLMRDALIRMLRSGGSTGGGAKP